MPSEAGSIKIPWYTGHKWSTARLSDVPEVTQLVTGQARIQVQVSDTNNYAHTSSNATLHISAFSHKITGLFVFFSYRVDISFDHQPNPYLFSPIPKMSRYRLRKYLSYVRKEIESLCIFSH